MLRFETELHGHAEKVYGICFQYFLSLRHSMQLTLLFLLSPNFVFPASLTAELVTFHDTNRAAITVFPFESFLWFILWGSILYLS